MFLLTTTVDPGLASMVSGILSFVGAAIGVIVGVIAANSLTKYRISQLEKKCETYDKLDGRVASIETWKVSVDKDITILKTGKD